MAATHGVGATLKLSTDEAVNEIKKLLDSIKTVKKEMTDLKKNEVAINVVIRNKGFQQMIDKMTKGLKDAGVLAERTSTKVDKIGKEAQATKQAVVSLTDKAKSEFEKWNQTMSQLDKRTEQTKYKFKDFRNDVKAVAQEFGSLGKDAGKALNTIGEGIRSAGFLMQSASTGISRLRDVALGAFNSIRTISSEVMELVGLDVREMVQGAIEQEEKLQLSQIGLRNMFGGDTKAYLDRIKETARTSATINAGDLADYIAQIAPVSNGFDQAYSAALGIIKTVAYGGGDPSTQMNYVVKNIRDVLAKGSAYKMDINQFNRAMPLLVKTLEARGLQQFIKNGQLEISKDNVGDLMNAFAQLNDPSAPQYAILEQMSHTLAGAREIFSETITQQLNTMLEEAGIFDFIQDSLSGEPAEIVGQVLEDLGKGLKEFLNEVDWQAVKKEVGTAWEEIKKVVAEFGDEVGKVMGLSGKNGPTQFFVTLVRMLREFIKGIIQGAKDIASFIGKLKEKLGDDGLEKLANTMGQLVTKGWLLEKVFSTLSSVLLTAANSAFLLSNLFGGKGGKGGIFAGLAGIAGSFKAAAGGSNLIGAGRYFAKGGSLKSAMGIAGGALQGIGIGALLFGIGQAAGEAIKGLELFGENSLAVGEAVKTAGNTVSGAVAGLFIGGPWGALIGGIAGLIKGINDWKRALDEAEMKKSEENIMQIKESSYAPVADEILKVFRAHGGKIDLDTKAGTYAYNQLLKYLEETAIADWKSEDAIDEIISALYNKQVGEDINKYTTPDNAAFQNAGGRVLNLIRGGDEAQMRRLAGIIREFNLVGYASSSELESTPAEQLVEEYLNGQKITEGQLKLIEEATEAAKVENKQTTIDVGGEIQKILEEGVNDPLVDIRVMLADIRRKVLSEVEGDALISPEAALQAYGSAASSKISSWGTGGGWFWEGDKNKLNEVFGRDYARDIYSRLAEASNDYYLRSEDKTLSAKERAAAKKDYDTVTEFIKEFSNIEPNDYTKLLELARKIQNDLTDNVLKLEHQNQVILKGSGFVNRSTTTITSPGLPRSMLGFAGGGRIKPIYRASGSGFAERGVDTVPAMLQPGEFVQRVSAVRKAGLGVMSALNRGDLSQAYRLLGGKLQQRFNNSRNYSRTYNRSSQDSHNQTTIINHNPSGVVDTYSPFNNLLAGA